MKRLIEKQKRHQKRKFRIRKKITGSSERPRMTIYKSNRFTYLQVVDDDKGHTLIAASNKEKELIGIKNNLKNIGKLGEVAAERLKEQNVKSIVFDRNGYRYHGMVKTIADAVRKAGILF